MDKWKTISGFPDYEVSCSGRIRSFKSGAPVLLKEGGLSEGYYSVVLYNGSRKSGKKMLVHRLTAEHHLPSPSRELVEECQKTSRGVVWVNHKDGDRTNNHADNLEWCTPSHNNCCTFAMGRVTPVGAENHRSILTEDKVRKMLLAYEEGMKEREISSVFGVSRSTFASIRQGFTWNHITGFPKKVQKPRGVKTKALSQG